MKLQSMIITILIIGMVSSGLLTYASFVVFSEEAAAGRNIADWSTVNNTSTVQQQLQIMYNDSVSMQNASSPASGTIVAFAPLNLLTGAYDMIIQMIKTPIFFINIIGDMTAKVTGMPTWFSNGLIAIISVLVIWEVIYLIIGRK